MASPRFSGIAGACAVTLFSFFIFTMQEPLAPLLLAASRVDPASIGLILGISYFGSLFVPVPVAVLVRKYGYKAPLAVSAFILAGSYVALGLFPSVATLLPGLFVIEAAKIALILGQQLQIGELSSTADSSSAFGWYSASVYTGQMLGPIASGFLLDRTGASFVWIAMASVMAAVAAGLYGILPGPPGGRRNENTADPEGCGGRRREFL
jgi:MFS family permease